MQQRGSGAVTRVSRSARSRTGLVYRQNFVRHLCLTPVPHLYDIELRFVVCIIILREIYTEPTQHTCKG